MPDPTHTNPGSKPDPQAWIEDYLNNELSPEDSKALEAWLLEDPAHVEQLARAVLQDTQLRTAMVGQRLETGFTTINFDDDANDLKLREIDSGIMAEICDQARVNRRKREIEDAAQTQLKIDLESQAIERDLERRRAALQRQEKNRPTKVIIIPKIVAVLGIAAMLGLVVWLGWPKHSSPPQYPGGAPSITETKPAPVYATVVRSLDARWDDGTDSWDGSKGLREGKHHLAQGLVEIELTDGVRVVLEGPVSFDLAGTNAMALTEGRFVATVPPAAIGFTVDTPTARIIDYGTEFGVEAIAHADGQSQTQVHVFRGEVRAAIRSQDDVTSVPVRLAQQQAAVIDAGGTSIARVAFDAESFERRVAKRLDLVDIVAGGDGLGDASGRGIDSRTGKVVGHSTMSRRDTEAWNINYAASLSRVPERPMVDGVFVVDRRRGSAILDSAGTAFGRFPLTPAGRVHTDFFGFGFVQAIAGGNVVMPVEDRGHIDQPFATVGRADLDGRAIVLHGGGGITFDLNEVTRQHAGLRPTRFSAHALSAEAVNQASKQTADLAHLDIWVLVDGEARFEATGVRTADGVIEIDIELQPGDRFLSLVCSDAGDSIAHDWLVLSQPFIEVGPPMGTD